VQVEQRNERAATALLWATLASALRMLPKNKLGKPRHPKLLLYKPQVQQRKGKA